jgi:hypothetical protein
VHPKQSHYNFIIPYETSGRCFDQHLTRAIPVMLIRIWTYPNVPSGLCVLSGNQVSTINVILLPSSQILLPGYCPPRTPIAASGNYPKKNFIKNMRIRKLLGKTILYDTRQDLRKLKSCKFM